MSVKITIGRQYGSGGKEIGRKLSQKLGIPFYDEEILAMVAEKTSMHPDIIEKADERATNSLLYSLITSGGLRGISDAVQYEMPINDKVFISQTKIIKELAQKGPCIFVGRCADYILKDEQELISIFIYSDMESRIERISRLYELTPQKAKERIIKKEKKRKTFYNYYTDRTWGSISNYDLCINTTYTGIDGAMELICDCLKRKELI